MEKPKEYYAFISYKREDEKWAKWLQDKLEHYKFPTNLNGRTDLPKKIYPTFRDVTDLSPEPLEQAINNALCNSEWLIVVCSPRSARSPWVCKEAQTFIDLGRADHIIPFVIEGNPFSNDTTSECYPEALLNLTGSNELLAANINEMGRDAAAIKVVARMFNLRFDALWQRYEREQKRKRWMWIGVSIFVALLGLSIGGYFVRQNGIIERQKERLLQDSITMANHLSRIQNDSVLLSVKNDSIASQNNLIASQRDSIEHSILQLQLSNRLLTEERDNVVKVNRNLKISNTKLLAKHALFLLNEGNLTEAINTLTQISKDKDACSLVKLPDVEYAMRTIYREATREGIRKRFIIDNIGNISFAQFDATGKGLYILLNDTCLIKYNTDDGKQAGIIGIIPDYEFSFDKQAYAYDYQRNVLFYSVDSIVFVKNVSSNKDVITPIKFNDDVVDVLVNPLFKNMVCELRYNDKEWHLVEFDGSNHSDYVIPDCNYIYAYSPDGRSLFADIGSLYCIYDIEKRCIVKQIPYENSIKNAHYSSNGDNIIIETEKRDTVSKSPFFNVDDYCHIDVFNISSNEFVEFGKYINGPSLAYIQENPQQDRFIVGDSEGKISVYRTDILPYYNYFKGKMRVVASHTETLTGHSEMIHSIKFDTFGSKMLSISDGKICIWDVCHRNFLQKYADAIDYIATSGNRMAKINKDGNIQLYDTNNYEPIGDPLFKAFTGFDIRIISRNNNIIVATKDSLIYAINTANNHWVSIPFDCYGYSLKLSLDEKATKLLIWDDYNGDKKNAASLSLFDINKEVTIARNMSYDYCMSIALSPNGKNVAISTGDNMYILDATTLEITKSFPHNQKKIFHVNYSNNGEYLISAGDRSVCLWNAKTGNLLDSFYGAERDLQECSMSYDNNHIIASTKSQNYIIKNYIWSVQTKQIVEIIESDTRYAFAQDVPSLLYSMDGSSFGLQLRDNHEDFLLFPSLETIMKDFKTIIHGGKVGLNKKYEAPVKRISD